MHHNPRAVLCSISNPLLTLTLNCQNTQKFKACPLCPLSACLSPHPHLWKYFRKHFVDFSSIQKCRLYASAAGRQMPPLRLALTCGFVFSVSAFCVGSSRRASLRLGLRLCFCFWLVSYIFSTLPLPPVVVGGCDSCHSFVMFFAWCRVQLNLAQLFVLVLLLGASHASACGICHKYAIGLSISNILWLYLAVRLDEFCHCEQHLQDRWVMPKKREFK